MLALLLFVAAFKSSSSVPLSSVVDTFDRSSPITILGRELPDCVNPSRQRSLQEIIWSCLATIFACTWGALHPNVPEQCTSGWKQFQDKTKIMIHALLAPEFVVMWAVRQRLGAAKHMANYNRNFHAGETPRTRSLLQRITGWFGDYDEECHTHNRNGPWTITHGFLLEMRGLVVDGVPVTRVRVEPDPARARSYRNLNWLSKPFPISEAEVNDKSKGDFLTKLFVVVQTSWFIVQVLARWIKHLPVTELEVVTLAFASLNIVTYAFWWNKPQNMQVPICVDTGERYMPGEDDWHVSRVEEDTGISTWGIFRVPFRIARFICRIPSMLFSMVAQDSHYLFHSSVNGFDSRTLIPMSIASLIFGGLHLIPLWTSSFPSIPERLLWMTSAISITAEPALVLLGCIFPGRDSRRIMLGVGILGYLIPVGGWIYVVARTILIVLAFITLRDLPPGAYQNVEWTTFIPHL